MASGRTIDYLGSGPIANRPATPNLYTGTVGFWYATDTSTLSAWDGSSWSDISGGGGGGGGSPVVELTGTSYTLGDLTVGAWHVFTAVGAVTITVEDDSVTPITTAAEYGMECRGAGGVSVVSDNDAVIYPPKGGLLDLEVDDFIVLKRTAEDVYKMIGSSVDA